ncbi:MAG: Gfo/Idh/MocA family protein [Oligosphaeraceae bacterium]
MARKLRVAQIGFGGIGHEHARQYASQPDCRLVAVADVCPAQFKDLEATLHPAGAADASGAPVKTYASYLEMIRKEKPDMVDICLPTDLHEKVAVEAMREGCHVLCEKPMARTVEEADRMMAVARETGRKLMIAQCLRFDPGYQAFRKEHLSGKHGRLLRLSAVRLSGFPSRKPVNWYADARRSGGAILDLHLHDTDFFLSLLGRPKAISSTGIVTAPRGGIQESLSQYDYGEEGPLVAAEGSWCREGWRCWLVGVYEKATLQLQDNTLSILFPGTKRKPRRKSFDGLHNGYWEEIAYLAKCILKNQEPERCLPDSTRDSLRIALEETRSAERQGRRIPLK